MGMVVGNSTGGSGDVQRQLSFAARAIVHDAVLYLNVSQPDAGGNYYKTFGVASPRTLSSLDKKFDDGIARDGNFKAYQAYNSTLGACLTGTDGDYLSTNTQNGCMAEYILKE